MSTIPITSLNDPRIAVYRDLDQTKARRESESFVVESKLLVERLLDSTLPTLSILTTSRCLDDMRPRIPESIPIYVAAADLLSEIVGFRFHRGMLACAQRPATATLAELIPAARRESTIVIASQILDPINLGAIIRNSAAFGVDGLLLGPNCADPYSRRVARVSMGTVFRLPIRQSADWLVDAHTLRTDYEFEIIGTVLADDAETLMQAKRNKRLALVFGTEGEGLSLLEQRACDRQVTLPMSGNTDSLNVGTACGIFLYHFNRIRQPQPGRR